MSSVRTLLVHEHYSLQKLFTLVMGCALIIDTSTLFTKMFPDSSIASKFACGVMKCSYLTSFFSIIVSRLNVK